MPAGAIPFPFGDCRVCADKATGVHYGVATCEGCKGFFKRSIPKADKYKCFYQGQCTLNPQERNRCKSCRFRRCLEVGMSVEGVKMGRIPKLEKEKALAEHRKGLESKIDSHPTEDIGKETASCSTTPALFEPKPSNRDHLKPCGQAIYNQPLLKLLPNKAPGNRCSSSDSGIDDDVRDLPDKDLAFGNYASERSHVGAYKEPTCDSAYSNVANYGDELSYMTDDLVQVGGRTQLDNVSSMQPKGGDTTQLHADAPKSSVLGKSHSHDRFHSRGTGPSKATSPLFNIQPSSLLGNDQASGSFPLPDSDIGLITKKSEPSSSSSSSSPSHSNLPFYPTVIKELLNQVIEAGHAKELQQSLVRHLLSGFETAEWRPESWIECLAKFRNCDAANGSSHSRPSQGKYTTQNLKRKADDNNDDCDHDHLDRSRSSLFEAKRTSHCFNEESPFVGAASDSLKFSLSDGLIDDDEDCHVDNLSAYVSLQREEQSKEAVWQDILESPESVDFNDVSERNKSKCAQLLKSNHKLNISDLNTKDVTEAKIPGASCPDRLERMKKLEAIANHVPILTFWDIPENTLGSLSTASPLPNTELEQCKKEIEQVIEWTKMIGNKFTEKSRLDLAIWDEEAAGRRPVHPLNLLTELSQKDIGIYWEEVVACVPLCNFLILGLCSSIPGFSQLEKDDRAILMEAAYFDVWLILLSSLFRDGECFLRLVCEARFSRFWMQVFMPEKLLQGMFRFVDELNSFNLAPCERIFLCAIQLTSKEHDKMKNPKKVHQLHDYYLDLLAYQLERTHQTNHSRILIKIFQLLPMLTSIGREQLELTSVLRVDHPPG